MKRLIGVLTDVRSLDSLDLDVQFIVEFLASNKKGFDIFAFLFDPGLVHILLCQLFLNFFELGSFKANSQQFIDCVFVIIVVFIVVYLIVVRLKFVQ